jgi:colanic acid biosynthesis protein WcaH
MINDIQEAIEILEKAVPNPKQGLIDEIFYYISRTTPLVNVDLLIQDQRKGTLFAWRDDIYTSKGWHLPGGIIRYKETIEERIIKVAECEVGAKIRFENKPLAINQIIDYHKRTRAHFISLLYRCQIIGLYDINNFNKKLKTQIGQLKWFKQVPADLLSWHTIYIDFINLYKLGGCNDM